MNKYYLHVMSLFLLCNSSAIFTSEDVLKEKETETKDDAQHYIKEAEQYRTEGNLAKAIVYYQKALEKEPKNVDLICNLAESYHANRNVSAATNCYQKALVLDPNNAHIHSKLGICYFQSKLFDNALYHLGQAINIDPNNTYAYIYLGNVYAQKDQHQESLTYYQKALNIEPNNADAYYCYGRALKKLNQFEAALEQFRIAHTINPQNIRNLLELGNTLNILNKNEEAISTYTEIFELNPNIHAALYNIGYTLRKMGHLTKAIDIFEKIIVLKPDYAQAHFSLALASLANGDFEQGWQEYEWRWKSYNEIPKQFTDPVWDGCDPNGKTIFMYAEQGLGDTFQFIRYAKLIKKQGGTVIFEAQNPLVPLLSLCPYIDKVVTKLDPLPKFDFHIALMSLPLIFNTRVETIPAEIPYLYANEQLVDYWKEKLAHDTNFKIGICWHGNEKYRLEALKRNVKEKSISLEAFAPIANIKGVSIYNLQKNSGTEKINTIGNAFTLHTFGPDFDETHGRFMDTAAIMKNLDLVISVDTAIAHLAGGLNVPTWILLPEPSDWRWLHEKKDTPWYPNMRLFKQPQSGDWESVIQNVVKAVSAQLHGTIENNEPHLPVEQVIDQITQPQITMRSPKQNHLDQDYQYYLKKYPTLEPLVESLARVNKQLQELDHQLASLNFSVFDEKCIEMAQKACYAHDVKNRLKENIQEIISS